MGIQPTSLFLNVETTLLQAGGVSHRDHPKEVRIYVSQWAVLLTRLGDSGVRSGCSQIRRIQ